jgi:uncharacterized protein YutE (UPF0331/DUF86 family)
MNEQIRKLIEQSSEWVCENYPESLDDNDQFHALAMEKFAELIVQECIDIIAPYTVRMSKPGEEYLHPILEIKEHFGVEE